VPFLARWPGRIEPGRVCDELVSSLDLYPTFARLAGTEVPLGREIDGVDVSDVLFGGAPSPREHLAHYFMDDLCAVRDQRWKLHVARDGAAVCELYDLRDDPGESLDVAAQHPGLVQRLERVAEGFRERLGDARLGLTGSEVRPIGRVEHAAMLTTYDPGHPYHAAEYDLPDRG
jgi:arylsulfatase A-like enzyme